METATQQNSASVGHDAPIQRPEEDLLNSLGVARAIHRVIRTAPGSWSTRIGLYGSWGSGKTSILNLLRQLEEHERSIVLGFSAWAASGESSVIELFYETLVGRLQKENIQLPFKQRVKHLSNKAKHYGWFLRLFRRGGEELSPVPPAVTKIASEAATEIALFATKWLKFKKRDLDVLAQQLGGRRVVVFIDDLDRSDPKVIPKTLLALRELLDWPGFTFVLAFDKRIITKALSEYSAAFGDDALGFLEKVIDIPFDVPYPNDVQKKRLAESAFKACCNCMPSDTLNAVMAVLPSQPRRIKLIARMMGALRPSLDRHETTDIDWLGLSLYLILIEANQYVADWVVKAVTVDEMDWVLWAGDEGDREKKEKAARETMRGILQLPPESKDADRVVKAGLQLMHHWDVTSNESVHFWANLGVREPSITRKEFRDLLEHFRRSKDSLRISEAVKFGANAAGIAPQEAANDLLNMAIDEYRAALDAMSESLTEQERKGHCKRASEILGLLEYLWCDCSVNAILAAATEGPITASLLGLITHWLAWTKNEGEAELRKRERSLALTAAESCTDPEFLYDQTNPYRDEHPFLDKESAEKYREWRTEVRLLLIPRIANRLFARFAQPDGLLPIASGDEKVGPWLIESRESPLYNEPSLAQELVRTLKQAANDQKLRITVGKNARLYLKQILFQTRDGSWGGAEHVKDIHARNPEILPAAWMAVLACPVPYRMLSSLRKLRSDLINAGVNGDLLPEPDWLRASMNANEKKVEENA